MRTRLWTAGTALLVVSTVAVVANLAPREPSSTRPVVVSSAATAAGSGFPSSTGSASHSASCAPQPTCAATDLAFGDASGPTDDGRCLALPEPVADIVPVAGKESPKSADAGEATRAAIRAEMPQITDEELEVWARTFQGVAPDVLRDLLRVKRPSGAVPLAEPVLPELPSRAVPSEVPALNPVPIPLPAPAAFPRTAERVPDDRPAFPSEAPSPVPSFPHVAQHDDGGLDEVAACLLHDLRNAHTPGYKSRRIVLSEGASPDAFSTLRGPAPRFAGNVATARTDETADDLRQLGPTIASVRIDASPGRLEPTGRVLDLAIEGVGWFRVQSGAGVRFTRHGGFVLNEDGVIGHRRNGRWWSLEPSVVVPDEATDLTIGADGTLAARLGDADDRIALGRLELVRFRAAESLQPAGHDLFAATRESGPGVTVAAGEAGVGQVRSGFLEASNVDVALTRRKLSEWRELRSDTAAAPGPSRATADRHGFGANR